MKKSSRRSFISNTSLGLGLGLLGIKSSWASEIDTPENNVLSNIPKKHPKRFNMCNFAAPAIPNVRIGFIGLGNRGYAAPIRICHIEGVTIKAFCDIREEKVKASQDKLTSSGFEKAREYFGKKDAWKELCESDDIDLVYICTPWDSHTEMAVYAMEHGKHVAVEVPAAKTIDEAWQLVETSERTKKHCMMLENCCYDFFELLTLNMARQGLFGELVHGEGAYIHNLMGHNFGKDVYYDMWRLKENAARNGNLYPTHGLGPVCQAMNINRGDKMEYLVSTSSADFEMAARAEELAKEDPFFKEFADKTYRGNMNTTTIKTNKGRTIMIQHDVTTTRPYSRIHLLSGTKGIARKYPLPGKISFGHEWVDENEMKELEEKYTPEIVKKVGDMAKKVGGHGGMDFIMDWRLMDCLRNGLPLDQDVYDAALWSCISPLSEESVANRSKSMDIPDFTNGDWKTNKPVDISLKNGGNTKFIGNF